MEYSEASETKRLVSATKDIGPLVRSLRLDKKLTGEQLAKMAGISQSRVSKIEGGTVLPPAKELDHIFNILECAKTIRQQVFLVVNQEFAVVNRKFEPIINQPGKVYGRELVAKHIRFFELNIIPALLQTIAYRENLLKTWEISEKLLRQKMSEILLRQDLLWDGDRSYSFLVHEVALYTQFAKNVQLGQLDRIAKLCHASHVHLGIIPLQAGLLTTENPSFILYDTASVTVILASKEHNSVNPQEVSEYLKIFKALEKKALYGDEATVIIDKAVQFFGGR